jgi:hypothetical protein
MIIYKAPDAPAGKRWHPTQDGAKAAKREHGGSFEQVEAGSDGRQGMCDLLNRSELEVQFVPEPVEVAAEAPPPFVAPPKPTFNTGQPAPGRPGGPRLFSAGPDNDLICDAIDESDGISLARFAEAVACRFASLAKREKAHG